MKIKNLVTVQTGSHLYGLATPTSDIDLYTIYSFLNKNYRPKRQVKQHIEEETDHVKISLEKFMYHIQNGVPQACEVLFAHPDNYLDVDEAWDDYRLHIKSRHFDMNLEKVLDTYRRTVINFFTTDDYKKNRHGFRLMLNARDIKENSYFNPTLTAEQQTEVTHNAGLPWKEREDLFKDQLWSIFQ